MIASFPLHPLSAHPRNTNSHATNRNQRESQNQLTHYASGFREHLDQRRCRSDAKCSDQPRRDRQGPRAEEGKLRAVTMASPTCADRASQLFDTEMDNFFALFRRYLNDKAKGNAVYASPPTKRISRLVADDRIVTGTALLPPPRARSSTTRTLPTPSRSSS